MKTVIFWDFDGVILNSNSIRDLGFETVLKQFPKEQVDLLIKFHQKNGGLSRYVKFRYFFEEIRNETITEKEIQFWAGQFSKLMIDLLTNKTLLIDENISFIRRNYKKYKMHIVSGSDEKELRYLCKKLEIERYFSSIHGSPTPKTDLVKDILYKNNYNPCECILIGDSVNDYEAAKANNIKFIPYCHLEKAVRILLL